MDAVLLAVCRNRRTRSWAEKVYNVSRPYLSTDPMEVQGECLFSLKVWRYVEERWGQHVRGCTRVHGEMLGDVNGRLFDKASSGKNGRMFG